MLQMPPTPNLSPKCPNIPDKIDSQLDRRPLTLKELTSMVWYLAVLKIGTPTPCDTEVCSFHLQPFPDHEPVEVPRLEVL